MKKKRGSTRNEKKTRVKNNCEFHSMFPSFFNFLTEKKENAGPARFDAYNFRSFIQFHANEKFIESNR